MRDRCASNLRQSGRSISLKGPFLAITLLAMLATAESAPPPLPSDSGRVSHSDSDPAIKDLQASESRLSLIEHTLAWQQLDELKSIQRSNSMILVVSGIFAVIGFAGLCVTAFLLGRGFPGQNRTADTSTSNGASPAVLPDTVSPRLSNLMEKLERRLAEMDGLLVKLQSYETIPTVPESSQGMGSAPASASPSIPSDSKIADSAPPAGGRNLLVPLLLGKGHTFMRLNQPEKALGCFEEAVCIDSLNAEALLKKGAALERLDRLGDALACYDRAISLDNTLTMAYLHKGGICNRLERYQEALECYDMAVKTQEKNRLANAIAE